MHWAVGEWHSHALSTFSQWLLARLRNKQAQLHSAYVGYRGWGSHYEGEPMPWPSWGSVPESGRWGMLGSLSSWPKLQPKQPVLVFHCCHYKPPQLDLKLTQEHGFTLLQPEAQRPWVSKQKHWPARLPPANSRRNLWPSSFGVFAETFSFMRSHCLAVLSFLGPQSCPCKWAPMSWGQQLPIKSLSGLELDFPFYVLFPLSLPRPWDSIPNFMSLVTLLKSLFCVSISQGGEIWLYTPLWLLLCLPQLWTHCPQVCL